MSDIAKVFTKVHQFHPVELELEISKYHCRFSTKSKEYIYAELIASADDESYIYVIDSIEQEDYDFVKIDQLEEDLHKRIKSIFLFESIKNEDKYNIIL